MLLNRYKVKTYKFNEFKVEDITIAEKILQHIKNNKIMYTRLVFMTASLIHFNVNCAFANEFSTSLDAAGQQILDLLMAFAKWGCIGFGVKDMIVTVLNGGNVKNAINKGFNKLKLFIYIPP